MGDIILWKYCAWLALSSSPLVPLAFVWRWLLKGGCPRRLGTLIPAVIASISILWFDAAVIDYRFVGPLYGRLHYAITGGNLLAAVLCGLFCLGTGFRRGARVRLVTCLACVMLAVEWTLLGIAYR